MSKSLYNKLLEAGLCVKCGNKSREGKTRCEDCALKDNEFKKRTHLDRQSKNMCYKCGKKPPYNNIQLCAICKVKVVAIKRLGSVKRYKDLMYLFLKQKQICPYTGIHLKLGDNASLDHKIPVSKGGTNETQNLQWVCKWANIAKHDYSEDEFKNYIRICHEHITVNE